MDWISNLLGAEDTFLSHLIFPTSPSWKIPSFWVLPTEVLHTLNTHGLANWKKHVSASKEAKNHPEPLCISKVFFPWHSLANPISFGNFPKLKMLLLMDIWVGKTREKKKAGKKNSNKNTHLCWVKGFKGHALIFGFRKGRQFWQASKLVEP